MEGSMKNDVTILITAYKEEKNIKKCLDSILAQKLPKKQEILVLTPDEPTAMVARTYGKKYKNLKVVKDPGKGKPKALNLAFKKVKNKILVLTDGDVVLGKSSIPYLIRHFKTPNVAAVSGRVVFIISKNSLFYEWAKLSEKTFDKIRKLQDKKKEFWHLTGYLYAMRSGIIKQIPVNVIADDAYIGYFLKLKNYLIKYEPKAKVYVKFPSSIKDFIKQKSRTRAGFLQLRRWFAFKERRILDEISFGIRDLYKIYGIKKLYKMIIVGLIYLIAWLRAYWIFLTKKPFEKIWERVETTK